MCGISGIIDFNTPISLNELTKLNSTIKHRGPDAYGVKIIDTHIGLGHNRLSIIDLSEAGKQPMADINEKVWITFNGEIYNYQTLRNELVQLGYQFKSNSDTEVIVNLYLHYGINFIGMLNGIFAFSIYDTIEKVVYIVRDHIGIKPLYYSTINEKVIFSSEFKSFSLLDSSFKKIKHSALSEYLTYGYFPENNTIFEDIYKLEPAHYLKITARDISKTRYWKLNTDTSIIDENEAEYNIETALNHSIKMQLVSDVSVGLTLSGGLDSTYLLGKMAEYQGNKTKAFTISFSNERDESLIAQESCKFYNIESIVENFEKNESLEFVEKFYSIYDEPFVDSSAYPTILLSDVIRKNHTKVVLGGDGGDEIFAGYKRYAAVCNSYKYISPKLANTKLISTIVESELFKYKEVSRKYLSRPRVKYFNEVSFFKNDEIRQLLNPEIYDKNYDELKWIDKYWDNNMPIVANMQNIEINNYLPNSILLKVDRATMFHGVEARVPFLDVNLVEQASKIDSSLVFKNNTLKYLLKKILVKGMPKGFNIQNKKGFGASLKLVDKRYKSKYIDFIKNGNLVKDNIIMANYLEVQFNEQYYNLTKMYMLINLELWYSKWMLNMDITSKLKELL